MPGTLEAPPGAPPPAIHIIKYNEREITEADVQDVGRVREYLSDSAVTWVNVAGSGDVGTLQTLSEIFGLHGLALEDVVNVHQRAKVDEYGDHLFIVLRMVSLREQLESEQLSLFLGKHFVLTFQQRADDCLNQVRDRLRQARGRIRQAGADYLAYSLIDAVVDAYFPVVDEYAERMEQLDEQVGAGHSPRFMEALHNVRLDLMTLRRAIRPLRDALILLMPDPHSLISQETQFYMRDCYDHTVQLMDLLDTYREMCSDLRDYYMSALNTRMNEVIKVLTIIATVFMPLSFIASIYGMNFNTELPGNMPELNWPYGYAFALGVMSAVGLGLVWFIWKKGWLARGDAFDDRVDRNDQPRQEP
jgi:magnesium transporter